MISLRHLCLLLANLFIPWAVYVFATGFFPYKPFLPGLASFEGQNADEEMQMLRDVSRPVPVFDKVFFMVVDALRSDFVYGNSSGFDFTQSLINNGAALPFTAHASPPTVTMPRVKALTTGSVPTFVDFILNFAESDTTSSLATQDTWLAQIREHMYRDKDGRVDFYGDDTWLKLFPDFFTKHDGTTSFFVSDFYEVDNNVTRNIPSILESTDWDGTIVHYLGLDHIGHKTGPEGAHMLSKQREMDSIVRRIYTAMETQPHLQNTVLVLAGDHGMNGGGNHGGSSDGETSTALVFMSPKFKSIDVTRALSRERKKVHAARGTIKAPAVPRRDTEFEYYSKISQSDLVPTLSGLLGLPIPKNSLGVFIPELMSLWYDDIEVSIENPGLQLLYRNALQMLEIVKATYGAEKFLNVVGMTTQLGTCSQRFVGEQKLKCLWGRAQRLILATSVDRRVNVADQAKALNDFLIASQDILSQTASQYRVRRLVGGIAIAAASVLLAYLSISHGLTSGMPGAFFAFLTLAYGFIMSASSYVEEEHRFWYWATSAWITLLAIQRLANTHNQMATAMSALLLLTLHRLATRWNQTGQKLAGAPDISRSFFPNHNLVLWTLIIATYAIICHRLVWTTLRGVLVPELAIPVAASVVVPAFVFKLNFAQADAPELVGGFATTLRAWSSRWDLIAQARCVFYTTGVVGLVVVLHRLSTRRRSDTTGQQKAGLGSSLHVLLTVFLVTQTRVNNVPLFLLFDVQLRLLDVLLRGEYPSWLGRLIPGDKETSSHDSTSAEDRPTRRLTSNTTILAVSSILLSMTTFFATGGSNAISSIDLSNAYNGVSSYNAIAVGALLFSGNWAGPIWWTSACALLHRTTMAADVDTVDKNSKPDAGNAGDAHVLSVQGRAGPSTSTSTDDISDAWPANMALQTLFVSASMFSVMLSCTVLRTHLFIWTVFSPKFLYAMAWSLAWHFVVNMGIGTLFYALG